MSYEDDVLFTLRVANHPDNVRQMDSLASGVEKTIDRVEGSMKRFGKSAGDVSKSIMGGHTGPVEIDKKIVADSISVKTVDLPKTVTLESARIRDLKGSIDVANVEKVNQVFGESKENIRKIVEEITRAGVKSGKTEEEIAQNVSVFMKSVVDRFHEVADVVSRESPELLKPVVEAITKTMDDADKYLQALGEQIRNEKASEGAKEREQKKLKGKADWRPIEADPANAWGTEDETAKKIREGQEAERAAARERRHAELQQRGDEKREREKLEREAAEERERLGKAALHRIYAEDKSLRDKEQADLAAKTKKSAEELEAIRNSSSKTSDDSKHEIRGLAELLGEARDVNDELEKIEKTGSGKLPNVGRAAEQSALGLVKMAQGFALLGIGDKKVTDEIVQSAIKIKGYADAFGGMIKIVRQAGGFLSDLPEKYQNSRKAAELHAKQQELLNRAIGEAKKAIVSEIEALEKKGKLEAAEVDRLRKLKQGVLELADARNLEAGAGSGSGSKKGIGDLIDAAKRLKDGSSGLTDKLTDIKQLVDGLKSLRSSGGGGGLFGSLLGRIGLGAATTAGTAGTAGAAGVGAAGAGAAGAGAAGATGVAGTAAVANPVGAAIAAVVGIVAAGVSIRNFANGTVPRVGGAFDSLGVKLVESRDSLAATFDSIEKSTKNSTSSFFREVSSWAKYMKGLVGVNYESNKKVAVQQGQIDLDFAGLQRTIRKSYIAKDEEKFAAKRDSARQLEDVEDTAQVFKSSDLIGPLRIMIGDIEDFNRDASRVFDQRRKVEEELNEAQKVALTDSDKSDLRTKQIQLVNEEIAARTNGIGAIKKLNASYDEAVARLRSKQDSLATLSGSELNKLVGIQSGTIPITRSNVELARQHLGDDPEVRKQLDEFNRTQIENKTGEAGVSLFKRQKDAVDALKEFDNQGSNEKLDQKKTELAELLKVREQLSNVRAELNAKVVVELNSQKIAEQLRTEIESKEIRNKLQSIFSQIMIEHLKKTGDQAEVGVDLKASENGAL